MKKIEKDKKSPSSLRHLFVKVMGEETDITLAVGPNDSIAKLKSMIKVEKGFPVDEQLIVYNERNLEDDRTVSDYNIQDKSTLDLVLRVPGRHKGHTRTGVLVTILTEASQRVPVATYTLAVRPTNSILEVKLKIRDMTGVPPHKQILSFADRELENTRTISDYDIRNDSVIYLVEKIQVYLGIPLRQERMVLELRPKDTVESVKDKIHAETKISPYRQILQFNGEHLDDVHSLNYYNIENKSMLSLYLAVEIFVKMSTGIDVRFKFIKSNTIKNVKERIQLSDDIPCKMQRLFFLDRLLEDKYTLSDYSIENGSILDCDVLPISVDIKMPNEDDYITLAVGPNDSIAKLKSMIKVEKGFPVDEQLIVYNERNLEDDRTVSDYNIQDKSTLDLVLRVPGRHKGHTRTGVLVTILTEASQRVPVATYTLAVRPTNSILEVKLKIRDMTGVPPHKQILSFADRELENTRTISDYDIRNDSVIYLVEKIQVYLGIPLRQERMVLELRPKDTVESVKDKIHAETKISPYRQILQFNGEHLDDVHSLNYYNIENKSMLSLYLAVEIFVKMSTGIDVRFKFIKSNTIKNVKERIQLSDDIPCKMQRLFFLDRLLEDKYTLSDYSIENGSILDCDVLPISVDIKMPNEDDYISVNVCLEDKVKNVIDKIQAKVAIPTDHRCLMYNGVKLVHCCTLMDYQIRNGSILNLVKSGGTFIDMFYVIYQALQTRCFFTRSNTEKRTENTTCSRVFLKIEL